MTGPRGWARLGPLPGLRAWADAALPPARRHIALGAEASVDVLGAAFEFTEQRTGGINFGFSLGIIYRF